MGRIVGENKHKGTLYPVDSKAIYRIIYEVVAVLPTENIKTSVIYCVPIIGKDNEYDMFLYIDGWSKIGSGSIDLSDYYTKEEVDDIVADISTLSFKIVQEKPVEDIETNIIYLIPKSGSSAGNIYEEWIYIDNKWELLGTTDIDLSNYMTLAPLNPTAEQIAALPAGQLYNDTTNHKGILKTNGQYPYQNGQEFYDSVYIEQHYKQIYDQIGTSTVPILVQIGTSKIGEIGSTLLTSNGAYILFSTGLNPNRILELGWRKTATNKIPVLSVLPTGGRITRLVDGTATIDFYTGDLVEVNGKIYECSVNFPDDTIMPFNYEYEWREVDYYTKTEIDSMIPTVPTNISAFTNDSGYLTLETLPIYDGTVI